MAQQRPSAILKSWLSSRKADPYPTAREKVELMARTGLTKSQLDHWFTNARQRYVWPKQRRGPNPNYSRFPQEVTGILVEWLVDPANLNHPYPSNEELERLRRRTGLSKKQVLNWFTNARKRRLAARLIKKLGNALDCRKRKVEPNNSKQQEILLEVTAEKEKCFIHSNKSDKVGEGQYNPKTEAIACIGNALGKYWDKIPNNSKDATQAFYVTATNSHLNPVQYSQVMHDVNCCPVDYMNAHPRSAPYCEIHHTASPWDIQLSWSNLNAHLLPPATEQLAVSKVGSLWPGETAHIPYYPTTWNPGITQAFLT